ncbi:phage portal protein [Vagococcus lutrae]|uniref:phage portal protein n=1 Tax=Vagococcus lutrae TaxID=81947 RepID=UPI00288D1479|nr:phage portal protein [Vagococcus lutrae]MDT2805251.1 phage portal protein [Vagococcus lutrae]
MSINFLGKTRFSPIANEVLRFATDEFETYDLENNKFIDRLEKLIEKHKTHQLPRLKELKRYYLADNNIKYRKNKTDEDAADNRIASDFARYITIFEQGYMLGKPVEYKNENEEILNYINDFSIQNNEAYHNVLIKTDLSIYGRAYELERVDGDKNGTRVSLIRLDPEQVFVVYDDTVQNNSLFAVRYYSFSDEENKVRNFAEVYTEDAIYYYSSDKKSSEGKLKYQGTEAHSFNGVPINEFANNEDRTGAYEAVLDDIDAYDLSQSELANFQQDSIDAILVVAGNPYTGSDENDFDEEGNINPNSRLGVTKAFKKARVMILDDNPNPEGSKPEVYYLVKEYDTEGAEKYKERLVNDILRFTFTPDTTDGNFAGVQSGQSMKYKLMASDNRRVTQERLFAKALMRRLRLAVNIWKIKGSEAVAYEEINKTNIVFSPNVPQNDGELVEIIKSLYGIISDETLVELLSKYTGVNPEVELERLEKENREEPISIPRRPIKEVGEDDKSNLFEQE